MSIATCIGRPRDTTRDTAIEAAAIELLREVGYDRITMEAVALRAHVSKATIYRRWKNKAELIAESVRHYAFHQTQTVDTGSLRGDLIEMTSEKVKMMKSADGQLVAGLLAAAQSDSEFSGLLCKSMEEKSTSCHAAMFAKALKRGEVSPTATPEIVLELTLAVISFRLFMTHQQVTRKFIEHFVDEVLIPVLNNK